ncbi:heterokaryon incompatibility protein-domain-containing protein [Whalleya microplaca]|nr:heterokaryon incompatibility protein-domain-containing protein [Whalleya microplaca]
MTSTIYNAMEWHDKSCRRLDLASVQGLKSCLACGSFEESSIVEEPDLASLHPPIKQRSEIRILRLQCGEYDEDIHCEMFIRSLDSEPSYEAISYTWADETGDKSQYKTIFISKKPFQVTRNCENALRRVRLKYSNRDIWIDAVCIDQNNIDERGHQVQLMPRIYSGALNVLIYVGEHSDNSSLCLSPSLSSTNRPYEERVAIRKALRDLFSRSYFRRVWVLQEVALAAHKATLICGDKSISWTHFCKNIGNHPIHPESPPTIHMDYRTYTDPSQWLDLLDLAANCEATDPRDKVYGLLGLIDKASSDFLVADYSLTVEQVYNQVALKLASMYGWNAVLRRAGTKNNYFSNLPSWVPDWRTPVSNQLDTVLRLGHHLEKGIDDVFCEYQEDEKVLTLHLMPGRKIDHKFPRESGSERWTVLNYGNRHFLHDFIHLKRYKCWAELLNTKEHGPRVYGPRNSARLLPLSDSCYKLKELILSTHPTEMYLSFKSTIAIFNSGFNFSRFQYILSLIKMGHNLAPPWSHLLSGNIDELTIELELKYRISYRHKFTDELRYKFKCINREIAREPKDPALVEVEGLCLDAISSCLARDWCESDDDWVLWCDAAYLLWLIRLDTPLGRCALTSKRP